MLRLLRKWLFWAVPAGGLAAFKFDPVSGLLMVLIVGLFLAVLLVIACLALIFVPSSAAVGIRFSEAILKPPRDD